MGNGQTDKQAKQEKDLHAPTTDSSDNVHDLMGKDVPRDQYQGLRRTDRSPVLKGSGAFQKLPFVSRI